jgi:hypothetical protein
MVEERPASVVFVAAWQALIGCVWLYQVGAYGEPFFKLLIAGLAISHFYSAFGLYNLCEWGRQRTVQLAVLDLLSAVAPLLSHHLSPFGALMQIGMPLYVLHALNDVDVRRRFS